jgi:hypothetical protein
MEVSHIYFIQEADDGDNTIPAAFPQNEQETVISLERVLAAGHTSASHTASCSVLPMSH